ncbi:MAG: PD-(D/E)XK nuclease family protein, partial [Defluviitaleaceae bacterium]|nr:PD-(D/E)XK nuclease family protein [Defluviitaleaceae bacterium]
LQAINSPRAKYDITEIATRLYNFLEAIGLPAALENWMADARVRGDNEALRWHEQIWGKIMDALDKMLEVLGGGRDTVGGFAKVLEAGIADMGIAPPSMDQLVVGDLRRSRFGELKALIVLGANDGVLPSYPEGGGLLDNGDRTELLRRGMNLAGDAIAKIYEEEFLIYAGFSKPSEYLAIMYSKGSLEGKASEPTRVLERLGELFPRLAVTDMDDLPEDSIAQISAPGAAFGDLVRAMGRRAAENIPIPPILLDAYGYFNTSAEYAHRLADMGQGTQFLVQNHGLSEKSIRTLYGKKMRTSVSKLERYAGCPFSYFAEYNLTAKSRKLHEVAAVDMGSIYHDILAKFGGLIQSMANFDEANMGREVGNIIDQVLSAPENQVLHSSGKYAHYAHKMRRISEISAAALTEHLRRGDFTLAYNEVALEGIQIPMDGDFAMVLDGRIDRVDMNNTDDAAFVKIIDYKSGRKGFSLSAAFHGLDMQLLVYLAAFIQRLSQTKNGGLAQKILPAAAFYFNLLNPIVNFSRDFQDNPDAVRREMLRSFKMSGILLDDGDVIHAMDRDIEATSDILPVAFKKGSTPEAPAFKKESSVVSREAFDALMEHVMTMAATCGEKIFVGGISANPAKHKGAAPCTYCDFRSICKFDAADNSKYRHLPNLKSEEVLARLGVTAKGTL